MNKKLKVAGLSTLGVMAIAGGTFAFFTDSKTEKVKGAVVGSLKIDANTTIKHGGGLDNLNPGDNDPSVNTKNRNGTDHEFKVTVENKGNKSAQIRNIIRVKVKDSEGTDITKSVKPEHILIYETEKSDFSIADKTPDGDSSKNGETNRGVNGTLVKLTLNGDTLEYTPDVDTEDGRKDLFALSGTGAGAEVEDKNKETSKSVVYELGLSKDVTNDDKLAGATITLEIETQALQYRNTNDSDWKTVEIKSVDVSTQK